MNLYREAPESSLNYRKAMLAEVKALLNREQRKAERRRKKYFQMDFRSLEAYAESALKYRTALKSMLGWPLTEERCKQAPTAEVEHVAMDDLGSIFRMQLETLPGVNTYGLYFRPKGKGPFPLVIAQHGGGGTPELCSGFYNSTNYNDMTRRVLMRGVAVFAPQLLLWNPDRFGIKHDKSNVDRNLKQVGGSLASFELHRIFRSLDYFTQHRDIDAGRIGMIGLSYGGFYTLYATALDLRIRTAVTSCFFNNRRIYNFEDWVWFDAANKFMDAEVGALICPRPLYVEVGKNDELFHVRHARPEVRRLRSFYDSLGSGDTFQFKEHEGGHELDKEDHGIDFLCRHLGLSGGGKSGSR